MKILLINPPLRWAKVGHYSSQVEKTRGIYPPLGLSYIAASLGGNGHSVRLIDCDIQENYLEEIESTCREFQPELVGFYVMTWTFLQADGLAKIIKSRLPRTKLVAGGPGINCLPHQSLKYGEFDFGVIGEGEKTIIELTEAIKNNQDFKKIAGLAYKEGEEIIINDSRPLIENLDSVPFPARDLLPLKKYFDIFTREKYFTTIIATRGCPYNCTFCDRKNRMGETWRMRSPENIIKEIKEINEKYGIKEFMFFDDNFIVRKDWVFKLCDEILKEKLDIRWEIRARADTIDLAIAQALKKAGCYRIRIGFEAGDNQVLKILQKGITVEQSLECAKICKKAGIEIFGYFMMGSPYETKETIEKTLNLALKINPDFAVFSKTILIPGSELFYWAVKENLISPDYWEKFLLGKEPNGAPAISTAQLSEEYVDKYISFSNKKFYFRPKYLLKRLFAIRNWPQFTSQIKVAKGLLK